MLATKRLIDSVWTLEYVMTTEGVTILKYDRENEEGYKREKELPKVELLEEEEGRIVVTAVIDGARHKVLNPEHIFSYS